MKPKTTDTSLSEKRNLREIERRRSNREAILYAAESVICRKGLNETSMDDVASEAGFSKATVYKYIPSKTELIFELLIHFLEELASRVREIVAKPQKHSLRLKLLVHEVVFRQAAKENIARAFLVDPALLRLVQAMIRDREEGKPGDGSKESEFLKRMLVVRRGLMREVEAFLQRGAAAGEFHPKSPADGARFLSAVIQGYQHDRFFEEAKPDLEKDVSDIYTFVLHGISSGK